MLTCVSTIVYFVNMKQKHLITSHGISCRTLASMTDYSVSYISMINNGERRASLQAAIRIASATENKISVYVLRPDIDWTKYDYKTAPRCPDEEQQPNNGSPCAECSHIDNLATSLSRKPKKSAIPKISHTRGTA